jgi:hypothetical protein
VLGSGVHPVRTGDIGSGQVVMTGACQRSVTEAGNWTLRVGEVQSMSEVDLTTSPHPAVASTVGPGRNGLRQEAGARQGQEGHRGP